MASRLDAADAPLAAWIAELASLGITAGCGGGNYCPNDPVTRQQMSAFLPKSLNGSGYVPPPAVGIFGDVPQTDLFAPWPGRGGSQRGQRQPSIPAVSSA